MQAGCAYWPVCTCLKYWPFKEVRGQEESFTEEEASLQQGSCNEFVWYSLNCTVVMNFSGGRFPLTLNFQVRK